MTWHNTVLALRISNCTSLRGTSGQRRSTSQNHWIQMLPNSFVCHSVISIYMQPKNNQATMVVGQHFMVLITKFIR